ncbi:MAG: MDR family MFS transporter, partial [Vicinamibacterales bacterium]
AAADAIPGSAAETELSPRVIMASMAGIIAVMLLAALDGTIVGTAMPRIIAELNGFNHYAAVTTAYMLAATVPVPIVGKLSDLYGRKPFLLVGVAIFVIGSALCGAATSMVGLIVARGIQGIGGGISQGMAFTTVADLFPPTRRGRISGVLGAVFGLASVIGPAVGGFLTDGPGWRWCFLVNLPIGVIAFGVLYYFFPHMVANKERRRVDWPGAVTLVLAVVPVLLALSWGGQEYAWSDPLIVVLLGGGVLMSAIFIWLQFRTPDAIMPPSLFKNRIVWTASAAATLVAIGMFGALLFIPLFIQSVIGRSAAESGAVTTPMMFCLIGSSMLAGQLMTRMGRYKALAVAGVSLTTVGMGLLTMMTADTAYRTVLLNMMVLGTGLGATMPVFNIAVQNAVSYAELGVATSSLTFLRSIGGSLGASIFGAILANRYPLSLRGAIPEDAVGVAPAMLAALENPQALMNPSFASTIPPSLARAVQIALSRSLHEVFLVGAVLVGISIVFALMLVDIPLRSSNRVAHTPEVT